jgi:hypothetical protein
MRLISALVVELVGVAGFEPATPSSRTRWSRASRHDLAAVGIISVNAPVTAPKLMPASTLPPALGGRQALRTVIFLFRSNALMSNAAIFIYFPPKPLKCYVKHVTLNQRVQGSSPCAPTRFNHKFQVVITSFARGFVYEKKL